MQRPAWGADGTQRTPQVSPGVAQQEKIGQEDMQASHSSAITPMPVANQGSSSAAGAEAADSNPGCTSTSNGEQPSQQHKKQQPLSPAQYQWERWRMWERQRREQQQQPTRSTAADVASSSDSDDDGDAGDDDTELSQQVPCSCPDAADGSSQQTCWQQLQRPQQWQQQQQDADAAACASCSSSDTSPGAGRSGQQQTADPQQQQQQQHDAASSRHELVGDGDVSQAEGAPSDLEEPLAQLPSPSEQEQEGYVQFAPVGPPACLYVPVWGFAQPDGSMFYASPCVTPSGSVGFLQPCGWQAVGAEAVPAGKGKQKQGQQQPPQQPKVQKLNKHRQQALLPAQHQQRHSKQAALQRQGSQHSLQRRLGHSRSEGRLLSGNGSGSGCGGSSGSSGSGSSSRPPSTNSTQTSSSSTLGCGSSRGRAKSAGVLRSLVRQGSFSSEPCSSVEPSCCESISVSASSIWTPVSTPRGAPVLLSAPPAPPPGSENQSWAWLVEGILQQVVQHLVAGSNLQAFRASCRHWKAVCDHNIRSLAPTAMRPKELVALFPRLQVLELTQCANVRNRDLFVLAESGMQLRCLTIGDDAHKPWVSNMGLISIGRMTSLRSLALHDCNSVTNNGLGELRGLVQLSSLSLRGCGKITNNGLEVLQSSSSLCSLNLHGCKRISDGGLAALVRLPLRALSLGLTRVRDEGMEHLAKLTQLTELHCTNEELTDEGIHHLSSLTELNTLALRDCCEVSGEALLVLLSALPHLAHLSLFKNWEFGDDHLIKCCRRMQGLRSLDLRGTWVTHRGLSELSQLSQLTKLALAPQAELAPEQTAAVAALTQLRSLTLSCQRYSPALMEAVARLTRLRELNLGSLPPKDDASDPPALEPHVADAVSAMMGLTSLDLSRRAVSEDQLHNVLRRLPRLGSLTVYGCPLSPEEVARVEQAFPNVNVLKRNVVLDASPELASLLGTLSIM